MLARCYRADQCFRSAAGRAATALGTLGAVVAIVLLPPLQSAWAVTPAAVACGFAACRAFPRVTVVMHQTPLYYDDLDHAEARRVFSALSSITMSILLAAVIDYGLFRFSNSHLSGFELVGVVGGMLSVYGKAHEMVGKALLHLIVRRHPRSPSRSPVRSPSVELAARAAPGAAAAV